MYIYIYIYKKQFLITESLNSAQCIHIGYSYRA